MILLSNVNSISNSKYRVSATHDSASNSDVVTIRGKPQAQLTFTEPMNGWGMYEGHWFFEISEKIFLFVQAYEHSRGGHHDQKVLAIDYSRAEQLWGKYLYGYNSHTVVVDDKKTRLWLINEYPRNRKEFIENKKTAIYSGCNLEEVNLRTGVTTFNKPVYLPPSFTLPRQVIDAFYERIRFLPFSTKWVEVKNEIFIEIYFGNFARQAIPDEGKYRIKLSSLV